MRRAAVQAFRTARCAPVWKVGGRRATRAHFSTGQALALRPSSNRRHNSFIPASLHSSMHVRNFSLAFISTLVASGAWYAYKGTQQSSILNGTVASAANFQSRGIADISSGAAGLASEASETPARRALLVENDQFYTAALSGDQPLKKQTDDSDRQVLEMLTPEQVTQKLRKNEESYLVGRGQGVVRYDLVQVPSNSPIEDDHAEKIVEVPQTLSGTQDGTNSDWMFWGVFDGHSYAFPPSLKSIILTVFLIKWLDYVC
jgi:pyruvate dehydrogenase phosphatase